MKEGKICYTSLHYFVSLFAWVLGYCHFGFNPFQSSNVMANFTTTPANIYLFKVNISNTRKRCEIRSKLTKKHQNGVTDVVLVFLLLALNIFHTFF